MLSRDNIALPEGTIVTMSDGTQYKCYNVEIQYRTYYIIIRRDWSKQTSLKHYIQNNTNPLIYGFGFGVMFCLILFGIKYLVTRKTNKIKVL